METIANQTITRKILSTPLTNIRYENVKFDDVIFRDTSLTNLTFHNCTFDNVQFLRTSMTNVTFTYCSFMTVFRENEGTNVTITTSQFHDSRLQDNCFDNFTLSDVRFTDGSQIVGNTLIGATMEDLTLVPDSVIVECNSFKNANMNHLSALRAAIMDCDFTGANLTHANFEGALLEDCAFDKADLECASLEQANVPGCSFRDSVLKGVSLTGLTIDKVKYMLIER